MNEAIRNPSVRRPPPGPGSYVSFPNEVMVACALLLLMACSCSGSSATIGGQIDYRSARDLMQLRRELIGAPIREVLAVFPKARRLSSWAVPHIDETEQYNPDSEGHIHPYESYRIGNYLILVNTFYRILDIDLYNPEQEGRTQSKHIRAQYHDIWGIRNCELLDEEGRVSARIAWSNDRKVIESEGLDELSASRVRVNRDEAGKIVSISLPE